MITRKVDDTTYQIDHGPTGVSAVVGDEKQKDFYPRVKIKKWDNECNYSFGLLDVKGVHNESSDVIEYQGDGIKAKFYPLRADRKIVPSKLRWLKMDFLDPYEAAAEYEMQRSLGHFAFTIATYRVRDPSIMVFGMFTGDRYLEIDKKCMAKRFTRQYGGGSSESLPVVRIPLAQTNPYFMDQGLVNIDIHLGHQKLHNIRDVWVDSVIDVLKKHGVTAYRQKGHLTKGCMKIYVKHKGRDVKVHSADKAFDIMSAYINFECDYNRVYDYYSPKAWPDVSADVRDQYAYGLKDIHPHIDYSIVDEIVALFAERCHVQLEVKPYTAREQKRIKQLTEIHKSYDWVEKAQRSDPGWHYVPLEDGYEFEVWLDKCPVSNIIELSMQHKNVEFFYQPPLTEEQKNQGQLRWSHVEGSWAVYHTNRQQVGGNEKYRVGKIGHIYRPWAEDAGGKRVWCDINIDAKNNKASITVPKDFLDSAQYPVMIDPTLGYTEAGASSNTCIDVFRGVSVPTYGYTGTVSSVTCYRFVQSSTSSGGMVWSFGVYRANAQTLMFNTTQASDATGALDGTSAWQTLNRSGGTAGLTGISDVAIGAWCNAAGYDYIGLYFDTITGMGRSYAGTYTYGWAAGPITLTSNDECYSAYITVGAGGERAKLEANNVLRAW